MEFRKRVRLYELDYVLPYIPAGARILELGAGAGWQASWLRKNGFDLVAVDLMESRYRCRAEFPVAAYDGSRLPFAGDSIDVIFSSNVLEHVSEPWLLDREISRVLKPTGFAIHVVPSTAWRVWTSLGHHLYVFRLLWCAVASHSTRECDSLAAFVGAQVRRKRFWQLMALGAWPPRHGTRGNSLLELYLFSCWAWRRHFRTMNWSVCSCAPTRIFYTGNELFRDRISIRARRALSYVLGSSTRVFLLRKKR